MDSVQAQIEARTLGFELLFKEVGLSSSQLNGPFTKPSGAQSKNPTIRTY